VQKELLEMEQPHPSVKRDGGVLSFRAKCGELEERRGSGADRHIHSAQDAHGTKELVEVLKKFTTPVLFWYELPGVPNMQLLNRWAFPAKQKSGLRDLCNSLSENCKECDSKFLYAHV